jgi:hypothetical protein
MAKRTAREFSATLEQQLKQFRPVRGEHHVAHELLHPPKFQSPSQQEVGRAAQLSSIAVLESYSVRFCHKNMFQCMLHACNALCCSDSCMFLNQLELNNAAALLAPSSAVVIAMQQSTPFHL